MFFVLAILPVSALWQFVSAVLGLKTVTVFHIIKGKKTNETPDFL